METMSSLVRMCHKRSFSSTETYTLGEVTEESMDLVRKIEALGSGNGRPKVEIKVTASGVVEE